MTGNLDGGAADNTRGETMTDMTPTPWTEASLQSAIDDEGLAWLVARINDYARLLEVERAAADTIEAQRKALEAARVLDDRHWSKMPVFQNAAVALDKWYALRRLVEPNKASGTSG